MTPTAKTRMRADLEAARLRAAQTAKALAGAPQAMYPGQSPQAGYDQGAAIAEQMRQRREAASAAQAPAQPAAPAQPSPQPMQAAGAAASAASAGAAHRAHTQGQAGESATPGIDAVLAVNKRAADRATAYGAQNVEDMAAQKRRRQQLHGELMAQSMKLANPGASTLELDMARRRAMQ